MDPADCAVISGASLRLNVRASLEAVREAARQVRGVLQDNGLSTEELAKWELVFVEAANNVAEHGNTNAQDEFFLVEVCLTRDEAEIRLTDHTSGFDYPESVELPDAMSEGGRGLFLMETVCDSVQYLQGRGVNCMILRKRREEPGEVRDVQRELDGLRGEVAELNEALDGMTEELASSYESLAAIFKFSRELGNQRDLSDFARLLLDHLRKITESDWYVLRIKGRDGKLSAFALSDESREFSAIDLSVESMPAVSCERQSAAERQDFWLEGWKDESDPLAVFADTRTGIVHPFYLNEDLVGTLAMGKVGESRPFSAGQMNVLHTFSDFLALQILNARYQDEHVKAKVVSRELEIAANIQRSLLPRTLPEHEGFTLAGFYQSARSVGGDFYDAVRTPCGGLLLTIADVMGKGVPAAMFSAILRTVLRAQQELAAEPGALLRRANEILFDDLDRVDMFITAQLLYVSPDGRRGVCSSAGHCPLFVGNPRTGEYDSFEADGPPLGVLRDLDFADNEFELKPESRAILYTDGITEARNVSGELWGDERMLAWWRRATVQGGRAEALKKSLISEVSSFVGGADATDDLTFLILGGMN